MQLNGVTDAELDEILEDFERKALAEREKELEAELEAAAGGWSAEEEAEWAADGQYPPQKAAQTLRRPAKALSPRSLKLTRRLRQDGSLGPPLPTAENLMEILSHAPEWHGCLAYNEHDCRGGKMKPLPA